MKKIQKPRWSANKLIANELIAGFDKLIIGDYTYRDTAIEAIDEVEYTDTRPIENFNLITDFVNHDVLKKRVSLVVKPNKTVESEDKRLDY